MLASHPYTNFHPNRHPDSDCNHFGYPLVDHYYHAHRNANRTPIAYTHGEPYRSGSSDGYIYTVVHATPSTIHDSNPNPNTAAFAIAYAEPHRGVRGFGILDNFFVCR